jgi:addiction module HigA family antidote
MNEQIPLGPAKVTPGQILVEEFLQPLGITQRELARQMGVPAMRVNEIVRGQRAVTADTALKLAAVLKTSARFWMNLQTNYDLARAALAAQRKAA